MDYTTAQLIQHMRCDMGNLVLNSKAMWLYAYNETCPTRDPQDVDVTKVIAAVKITIQG